MQKTGQKFLHFRADDSLITAVQDRAEIEDRSVSNLLRVLVIRGLKDERRPLKTPSDAERWALDHDKD